MLVEYVVIETTEKDVPIYGTRPVKNNLSQEQIEFVLSNLEQHVRNIIATKRYNIAGERINKSGEYTIQEGGVSKTYSSYLQYLTDPRSTGEYNGRLRTDAKAVNGSVFYDIGLKFRVDKIAAPQAPIEAPIETSTPVVTPIVETPVEQPQLVTPGRRGNLKNPTRRRGKEAAETPATPDVKADIEAKRIETEAKIKRTDLFSGVGEFSTELGGSDKAAVPISHREKNGIEFVEYAHPETGSVDVIVTGKSDNDFVGFYRLYENGKPTNKWSSKFENQSRNKEDFKTMISGVQEMLPAGHEYTEKTSISTDGLRVWTQQLERGYQLQYDENGKLKTNSVFINGDAIVNELGIPVNKGNFDRISVKTREDFEKVKKVLLPYLEKLGLNESNIKWISGNIEITDENEKAFAATASVKIDLPILRKTTEDTSTKPSISTPVAAEPALKPVVGASSEEQSVRDKLDKALDNYLKQENEYDYEFTFADFQNSVLPLFREKFPNIVETWEAEQIKKYCSRTN
jgi:hypothetical protein